MDGEPLPSTAAVVLASAPGLPPPTTQYPEPDSDDDSEDDADDALLPPGPVDPDRCTISGPGYSGGAAQSAVSFFVTAKDAAGKRIREGGADFQVRVEPRSNALANGATVAELTTRDNGDGTYTASYAVTARGDYELSVDMNGKPIGGSPFPVFFSPPEVAAPPEAQAADMSAGALTSTGLPNSLAETAQQIALRLQPDLAKLTSASMKAANMLPAASSMGGSAHIGGVIFPTDEALLDRSLLVGNITSVVNAEQLQQLFGFCGTVRDCRFVGIARTYAFVEFDNEEEATSALSMNNLNVMGSLIKVELAISAYRASPQGAPDPIQQLQAHQLAQLQLVQMQQESLAAQVAQMRAAAKTLPNAAPPVVAQNSQSQKAAALAAAAALSKRLGLAAGGGGGRRSPSPPRGRRRRSASPRERRFRLGRTDNRAREAERAAERETEQRAQQEAVRRARSSRRSRSRSAGRDGKSRDRDRDGDGRSREGRDRDRDRDRERDERRAGGERHRSHGKDSERKDRDRDRDRDRDSGRNRDRDRDRDRNRDRDRDRGERDRESEKGRRRDDSRERRRGRERAGERRTDDQGGGERITKGERGDGNPPVAVEAPAVMPDENGQEAVEESLAAAVANGVDADTDRKRDRDSALPEDEAAEAFEERPRKRKHHKKDKDKHRRKEKHSRRERRSQSLEDGETHDEGGGAPKDAEAEGLRALALQKLAGNGAEEGGVAE